MSTQPSALWLPFVADLRRALADAGFSLEQLAAETGTSLDLLHDIEQARRRPARSLVSEIDTALGTGRRLSEAWSAALQFEAFPHTYTDLRTLEVHAYRIREWEVLAIPMFLRSRGYAEVIRPPIRVGPAPTQEEWLGEQMGSRDALTGPAGPSLEVVVDERALTQPVGGPEVHSDQLDLLADLGTSERIDLRYIPSTVTNHPGLGGSFRIMDFTDRHSLAFLYSAAGGKLVADDEDLEHCEMLWERIMAVSRPVSRGVLDQFKRTSDDGPYRRPDI